MTCRGLILASILLCAPLHAAEPLCVPCEVKRIAEGATDGTLSQIITSLKQRREDDPDNRAIHLLLASAYERDDNLFWARNVLYAWTAAHPADCEALSLLAWLQLRQGAPGEALSLLTVRMRGVSPVTATMTALRPITTCDSKVFPPKGAGARPISGPCWSSPGCAWRSPAG